jgi:glutathione transport system substrate-binding protein
VVTALIFKKRIKYWDTKNKKIGGLMMLKLRWRDFTLLVLVLMLALGVTIGNAATKGKSLTFGLSAEPKTLDPAIMGGTFARTVNLCVYRGLLNYGRNGKITPELAESYTVAPDGKTYTFKLRNAKFQNGDPVTAEDVKYTFERIMDPKTKATYYNEISIIDKIEIVDKATVKFILKNPCAPFIHYLSLTESGIVSKKWTEEKGGNISASPMGAGPFRFVSWTKGTGIVLKKSAYYYKKGLPKLDSVKFVFYADEDTRYNALQAGDIDIIEYVPWKYVSIIEKNSRMKLLTNKNGPFMMMRFNTHVEPLGDPRVRQAISYAIDRKVIIDTAFNGRGAPIYGIAIPKGYLGYNPKYQNYYRYNLKKAKQLLKEAGYPNGFNVKLLSTSTYSYYEQTAVAVQSELKKVGINVILDLPDWATRTSRNLKGEYEMTLSGTAGDWTDPDWLSNFFYGGTVRLANSAYFNDPQINQLLDKGKITLDPVKRKQIYEQFVERALKLEPLVCLNWREQSYAMKSSVTGFQNLPGFLSFQSGITIEDINIK